MKTVDEAIRNYNVSAPVGMKKWIAKRSEFMPRFATNLGAFHGVTVGPITKEKYESKIRAKTEADLVGAVTDKGRKCMENARIGVQV